MARRLGRETTERELIESCREHLARDEAPRSVVSGPPPKTSTGKTQKLRLREPAWAGQQKRIH